MGHSAELIERVVEKVKKLYPPESGYSYLIENKLGGSDIDIYPDLQIVDPEGRVVCVVDIGYTQPRKIARYRRLGIPDIRCISQDGRFLGPDEYEQITKVEVERGVAGEETWREVDVDTKDGIFCPDCFYRTSKSIEEKCGHDEDKCNYEVSRYLFTAPIYGELWCNGLSWFCIWQCDDCGRSCFLTGDKLKDTIVWGQFEGEHGFSHDKFVQRHDKERDDLYAFQYKSVTERVMRRALYCDIEKKCSFGDLRKYILDRYAREIQYTEIDRVPGPSPD